MPLYEFECECGGKRSLVGSMANPPREGEVLCDECGSYMHRNYRAIRESVFKPYVERNFDGTPILVTSVEQRERHCDQYRLTYERGDYIRPKRETAADQVTFDEVAQAIKSGESADVE